MFCGISIYFFYAFLRLRFLDVETIPGPRGPVTAVCKTTVSNVWGLAGNLSALTVASYQYDTLLCSETLVSDMRQVSELQVSGFGYPAMLCWGRMRHTYDMDVYAIFLFVLI